MNELEIHNRIDRSGQSTSKCTHTPVVCVYGNGGSCCAVLPRWQATNLHLR